ncbi:unconventional myosin-XVI-like isoform X2 [Littorina saxatilis]
MAELLVLRGADVNMRDDDWWTPLHVACYQESADIVQLLLTNGGDVSLMDVDGNFPIDHAPQNTDTWDIVISFMESKGLSEKTLKKMRHAGGCDMEDRVMAMVRSKNDVNTAVTDDGVTMLHIASSNGYLKCGKLLLKHGADVTRTTHASGWTALHCAAKYGQTKIVKMLVKNRADVTATDKGGHTPFNLATEDEIQKILLEAKSAGRKSSDEKDDLAVGTDDEDEITTTKIIRPSHLPLSKADRLMEGQMLLQARTLPPPPSTKPPSRRRQRTVAGMTPAAALVGEDESDDEVYDEIFSNTIYSITETDEGQLPKRSAQDDLSSLPSLTERLILDTVLERFAAKHIYTYMGDVLIAVNPFTHLPLYGKWASKTYRQASSLTSLPPHAYAIAEHALRAMTSSRTSQCCVIGGESGAGKTETSKLLVQHLMCAATTSEHQLNSKLHQINPLLEAFGNAKTTMNENSSRFAKYLELVFSPDGRVLGGHLNQYLLEKSRVVHQGAGESSFHIFSWLLGGATPEERAHCMLEDAKFKYLPTSGGPSTGHAQQKLLEVRDCMKFVGFSQDDVSNMVTTVAAVLHLGNVRFTDRGDGHTATLTQPGVLHKVCKLLRVAFEDMSSALTEDTITARGEDVKKPLTVSQCMANVQAVSMSIYSRLFAWIVNGINQMVAPLEEYTGEKFTIGILDIFGFEHLQSNGFEQMCINLANERLQQYYQTQVFERERQECLLEGVQPVSVVFPSSQQVIDLFMEKNTGVYDLLDEESCFPKASDDTLATKLHSHLGKKHDRVYKTPRNGGTSFTVVHYAGAVQYTVEGVLEKNRDTLSKSLSFVMRGSESVLVKELFRSGVTRTGSIAPSARQRVSRKMKASRSPFDFFKKLRKNSKETKKDSPRGRVAKSKKMPSTLTFHFKNSLQEMLGKLEWSTPHFIRCIKSNPSSRPLQADAEYVGAQLRYTGVLQTAILRQQGFAVRPTFLHFLESYSALVHFDGDTRERSDHKACVTKVMKSFQFPLSQVGQSKVFLRLKQVQSLEEHNARLTAHVITAQSAVRRFMAKNFVEKRRIAREEYRRQLGFQKELEKAEAAKKETAEEERRQRKEEEEWSNTDQESSRRETTSEGDACSSDDEFSMRRPKEVSMMGVPAEARQSLKYLDSVLSQFSPESPWQPDSSFDSGVDRSDDVFSHGQ